MGYNTDINDTVGNTAMSNVAREYAAMPVKWNIKYTVDGDAVVATVRYYKNEMIDLKPEIQETKFRFTKKEVYGRLSYEVEKNILVNNAMDLETAKQIASANLERGICQINNDKELIFAHRVATANRDARIKSINKELKEIFKEQPERKKYDNVLRYFSGPVIRPRLCAVALFDSFIHLLYEYNYWRDAQCEIATVMAS